MQALWGTPCNCKGGYLLTVPATYTRSVDCGGFTAYLNYKTSTGGGFKQDWKCVNKPTLIPSIQGKPGPCPSGCSISTQMHSTCYREAQQCTHTDGKVYLTAILQKTYSGSFGGENDYSSGTAISKYAQASCIGTVGKPVCWPPQAPIHVSDGGGPSDRIREEQVQRQVEEIIRTSYPSVQYHPLALPKSRGPDLDTQTANILAATHQALNVTTPRAC